MSGFLGAALLDPRTKARPRPRPRHRQACFRPRLVPFQVPDTCPGRGLGPKGSTQAQARPGHKPPWAPESFPTAPGSLPLRLPWAPPGFPRSAACLSACLMSCDKEPRDRGEGGGVNLGNLTLNSENLGRSRRRTARGWDNHTAATIQPAAGPQQAQPLHNEALNP